MSLSADDLAELLELWAESNLSAADQSNLSSVETLLCSGAVSHAAFLHVLAVLYVFIFLVGVAANALVLWASLRRSGRRSGTRLYVANVAVADLCVATTLPVWAASLLQGGRWPFGETLCRLSHLLFSVNLFSSIFFLACMSVDRYLSVAAPSDAPGARGRTAARRLVCVLVWLLALLASVPDAYFLRAVKSSHSDATVCRPVYPPDRRREWMVGVQLSFTVLGFAIPLPVIAVFYLLLAARVPAGSDGERRLVLAYVGVFLACWLPLHAVLALDTLSLLGWLPFSCRLEDFLDVALQLTQCLSLLHCCLNPLLYSFLHRRRRYDIMRALIFKFSTRTGLAKLIDGPQASDTESSVVADGQPPDETRSQDP